MRRGKIGLDNPWAGFVSVNQIVDFRIVLEEWSPQGRNFGFPGIAGSDKRKRAGAVQGIGGGAGDPIIDTGTKTIVKRERQGERANRVVGLAALANRRQLRHHDAALRIYVLKRKGGLGADQRLKLAIDLLCPGGTISSVGVHTAKHFSFSPGEAYDKNLIYKSGRCPAHYYAEKLLNEELPQRYAIEDIITHQFSLQQGAKAYEVFDKKLDNCIKAVLMTS